MRLRVRHRTTYSYSDHVSYAIQTLRLTPRPYDGLVVRNWRVTAGNRRPLPAYTDGWGNIVHSHSINKVHEDAAVTVDGEVETIDTNGVVRGLDDPLPPRFYLRQTPLTASSPAIAALVSALQGDTPLDLLEALMAALRSKVTYVTGSTHAATTATESLAAGTGVCQDYAHIFVAAGRQMGMPSRYVGGYLWTGSRDSAFQASHAWAEVYVPDVGWVGFDPSNDTRPTEAHIRTATGLDYWSAAPIRGIRVGRATEALDVNVQVSQAEAEQ